MIYLDNGQPSHPGGPNPKDEGWIYIAYDYRDLTMAKIGITKRPIFDRIFQSTTNPCYMLFAAFRAKGDLLKELPAMEKYFTRKFRLYPFIHPSGQKLEWWPISPPNALKTIVEKLSNVGFTNGLGSQDGWDFTEIVYFPKIDPYSHHVKLINRDGLVWMAMPDLFLQEVFSGNRPYLNIIELDQKIKSGNASDEYFLQKPSILINRLNYYKAFI